MRVKLSLSYSLYLANLGHLSSLIWQWQNNLITFRTCICWILTVLRLWYGLWQVDMHSPIDIVSEYHQERVTVLIRYVALAYLILISFC